MPVARAPKPRRRSCRSVVVPVQPEAGWDEVKTFAWQRHRMATESKDERVRADNGLASLWPSSLQSFYDLDPGENVPWEVVIDAAYEKLHHRVRGGSACTEGALPKCGRCLAISACEMPTAAAL